MARRQGEFEHPALTAIMRECSYLPRGSETRKVIEKAASERLRELRAPSPSAEDER